jgi:hypothetical protein
MPTILLSYGDAIPDLKSREACRGLELRLVGRGRPRYGGNRDLQLRFRQLLDLFLPLKVAGFRFDADLPLVGVHA